MATAKKPAAGAEITIMEVVRGRMDFCILGTSPLIMHRMSEKAWHELLAPKGRKNEAEKAASLKHDPIREFRDSPYMMSDHEAPALLALLTTAFKGAMCTAALDTPGSSKAQIGRLVYVSGDLLPVFGIPKVFMSITRSADQAKTPDVRTRGILPEWACYLSIEFTKPILRDQSVANLLAAAGIVSGVGDWRPGKGTGGSYGTFKLVSADHPDFVRICKTMGRAAQQDALDHPIAYNDETSEMLAWFDTEVKQRGFSPTSAAAKPARVTKPAKAPPPVRASKGNGHDKGAQS